MGNGHTPTLPMHENIMSSLKHICHGKGEIVRRGYWYAALRVRLPAASVGGAGPFGQPLPDPSMRAA